MADKTLIAWADSTTNFWMGCAKVSAGCKHCYADTLTSGKMGLDVFGAVDKRKRTSRTTWSRPRTWNREAEVMRTPRRVFTNSLADFFEDAPGPNSWRRDAWEVIRMTPMLDWLVLTKRPSNIARMLPDDWDSSWSGVDGRACSGEAGSGMAWHGKAGSGEVRYGGWPNVWLGVSVENNKFVDRARILAGTPAFVHFVSYEPALGPVDQLSLDGIDWLICGGESGPGFRKMDIRWAYDVWNACKQAGVPFFFKQGNGIRTEMNIDALGRIVREYPPTWDRARARTSLF